MELKDFFVAMFLVCGLTVMLSLFGALAYLLSKSF